MASNSNDASSSSALRIIPSSVSVSAKASMTNNQRGETSGDSKVTENLAKLTLGNGESEDVFNEQLAETLNIKESPDNNSSTHHSHNEKCRCVFCNCNFCAKLGELTRCALSNTNCPVCRDINELVMQQMQQYDMLSRRK
ncbi:hypothetical protein K469DRAFT_682393 [Zopfia rhizophila CBS 207.26]|uniref:Uncharacterized protein n=1 Tax=Zopfia rhizophila CBS 207.26 TaxID=1314779 RepID=A0A6A6EGR2_9PEZI|nr:hypothetical protein K469DRAFT_682393 [Zopfia rhizophila CBS 207.26]